jgi:ketosteroid isomerase-like protein
MLKKNILMMTLLSSFLVTVNAQEQVKPSPVAVAKTAFGATLPAANPIPANAQVTNSVPATNPNVQPTQVVPSNNTTNPSSFVQSGPHAAPMTGKLNMGSNPTATANDTVITEQTPEVPVVNGIDEKTRLDNEAIRNVFNVFSTAINTKNNGKLLSVMKPQAILIGNNQELISGKKSVEEYFPKTLGTNYKFERIGFSIEPGAMIDIKGDMATVYGRGTEKYKLDSVEYTVQTRWSATVVKDGEEWKIASFHSGVNFTDNSIIKSFEEFGWKAGIAAGLIGLFIGFVLALGITALVKRQ